MQAVDRMPVMDVESVVLNLDIINAITVFVQASPEFPSSTPFSSFFLLLSHFGYPLYWGGNPASEQHFVPTSGAKNFKFCLTKGPRIIRGRYQDP